MVSSKTESWTDPQPLAFARALAETAIATGSEHVSLNAQFVLELIDNVQRSGPHETPPVTSKERLSAIASDIADGFNLTAAQIITIYNSVQAALSKCPACHGTMIDPKFGGVDCLDSFHRPAPETNENLDILRVALEQIAVEGWDASACAGAAEAALVKAGMWSQTMHAVETGGKLTPDSLCPKCGQRYGEHSADGPPFLRCPEKTKACSAFIPFTPQATDKCANCGEPAAEHEKTEARISAADVLGLGDPPPCPRHGVILTGSTCPHCPTEKTTEEWASYTRPEPERPPTFEEKGRTWCSYCQVPDGRHRGGCPAEEAWDCACNKPDCAYCGQRLASVCQCHNMKINTPLGIPCPDCGRPL